MRVLLCCGLLVVLAQYVASMPPLPPHPRPGQRPLGVMKRWLGACLAAIGCQGTRPDVDASSTRYVWGMLYAHVCKPAFEQTSGLEASLRLFQTSRPRLRTAAAPQTPHEAGLVLLDQTPAGY